MSAEQITVEDGKYTVIFDNGQLHALRYGERWRDLSGDKLIYALMCRIQALEAAASACLSHPAGSDRQPGLSLAGEQPAEVSDEPTEAQIAAGMRELFAGPKPWPSWEVTLKRVYQAMFALRPQSDSEARRAAQEQLYTERERHTAEVKRLQAEIGRLQSLSPQAVPMTGGWQEVAACPDGDVWFSLSCGHVVMGWKQGPLLLDWEAAVDHDCCSDASAIKAMPVTPPAHHGITAPAGGEVNRG